MKRISGARPWIAFLLMTAAWAPPAMVLAQANVRPPAQPPKRTQAPQAPAATSPQAPAPPRLESGEPHWIWAPDQQQGSVPSGTCYFRKVFQLQSPEQGQVAITCDDAYELYVNGRRVGVGRDWKTVNRYDITRYLANGRNSIAVKAENTDGGSAGLVALVTVRQVGHTDVSYSTDERWKVSRQEQANWFKPTLDDRAWANARSLGEYGRAAPWAAQKRPANGNTVGRFKLDPQFHVERVAPPDKTGSLIAMAFNEWGQILFSIEQGGIGRLEDKNSDGVFETYGTYCDQVKNCQGLLPLNGQVFVCGEGSDGPGLYRLSDEDRDNKAEKVELLFAFAEPISEHGPHAIQLGPDGLLYVLVGNHGAPKKEFSPTSPYRNYHEGDLIQPRYEDPAGHGTGVKAPGGMVLRTDLDGSVVEVFAGGLRNAYDMCFNEQGELFTVDSDKESDDGSALVSSHAAAAPCARRRIRLAQRLGHLARLLPRLLCQGSSRSAAARRLAWCSISTIATPIRCTMRCSWATGRAAASWSLRLKAAGGTYEAKAEVFVEGQPLNVTDLAVGRDGWLYFCTGGRGTEGGIYRVVFDGKLPPPPKHTGIAQALKQPQLESAWGREQLAALKDELGPQWDRQLNERADRRHGLRGRTPPRLGPDATAGTVSLADHADSSCQAPRSRKSEPRPRT